MKMRLEKHQQLKSTGNFFRATVDISVDADCQFDYEKSFLCAVKPVIYFSQFFGLFPISGLTSRNPQSIKFRWISLRTLFSICFVFASIFVALRELYRQFQSGPLSPSNIIGFIFFSICSLICIFFLKLATRFSEIMDKWQKLEKSLKKSDSIESSIEKWSLKKRVNTCATVMLLLAVIEHLMSLASHSQRVLREIENCNLTQENFVEDFITKHLFVTFSIVQYNHFYGFLFEYFNVSFTFYWSFLDVYIMLVSIGISFNFDLINNRIKFFRERALPDMVWADIRQNYNAVCDFLKFIDGTMDKVIVLACCSDSYFIIIQLLNLTNYHVYIIDEIYFYCSLAFLMIRTCAMFLIASSIFENSRKPLQIIRSIPNEGWHQEIERFNDQIRIECNALSGMKFFYMTKKVLFGLAGTILTYTLVLLEFNTTEDERNAWEECNG